jgi:transposase
MPRLELVIRQLLRAQFGRKSERLDPAQFQLTLENLEQEIAAAKAPQPDAADSDGNRRPRRAPARRNHLPAHLERDEVVIEPEDRNCLCCGGALHQIDIEERLDAVPLRVRVTRRPIYGCRSCAEAVVQAPAPDSAIPGGLPTEGLLAQVAVSKYNDGLPLYRQILERDGIHLDRATLDGPDGVVAQAAVGTAARQRAEFAQAVLRRYAPAGAGARHGQNQHRLSLARDDSPWRGDLPPAYVYTEDRVRAREVLADYTGVLQVDGGFKRLTGKQDALQGDASPVTLAFCWSHGRRQFFEIHQSSQSPIAGEVLRRIAELYRIEDAVSRPMPDGRFVRTAAIPGSRRSRFTWKSSWRASPARCRWRSATC